MKKADKIQVLIKEVPEGWELSLVLSRKKLVYDVYTKKEDAEKEAKAIASEHRGIIT